MGAEHFFYRKELLEEYDFIMINIFIQNVFK